jgi:hypothetical protein
VSYVSTTLPQADALEQHVTGSWPAPLATVATVSGTPVEPHLSKWQADRVFQYGVTRPIKAAAVTSVFDCTFTSGIAPFTSLSSVIGYGSVYLHLLPDQGETLAAAVTRLAHTNLYGGAVALSTPIAYAKLYGHGTSGGPSFIARVEVPNEGGYAPETVRLNVTNWRIAGIFGIPFRQYL